MNNNTNYEIESYFRLEYGRRGGVSTRPDFIIRDPFGLRADGASKNSCAEELAPPVIVKLPWARMVF